MTQRLTTDGEGQEGKVIQALSPEKSVDGRKIDGWYRKERCHILKKCLTEQARKTIVRPNFQFW